MSRRWKLPRKSPVEYSLDFAIKNNLCDIVTNTLDIYLTFTRCDFILRHIGAARRDREASIIIYGATPYLANWLRRISAINVEYETSDNIVFKFAGKIIEVPEPILDCEPTGWKYVDEALKFANLWAFRGCISPAKEVTESMAIYNAINHLPRGSDVAVYVIGDGNSPRMASLLTGFGWKIYSIDPLMKNKYLSRRDITCVRDKSENVKIIAGKKITVLVAVHSHAPFTEIWKRIPEPKIGIAIPCCVPPPRATL